MAGLILSSLSTLPNHEFGFGLPRIDAAKRERRQKCGSREKSARLKGQGREAAAALLLLSGERAGARHHCACVMCARRFFCQHSSSWALQTGRSFP